MSGRVIDDEQITKCEKLISYTFQNKKLLLEALQASPQFIGYQGQYLPVRKNSDIAILGNHLIKIELWKQWYKKDQPRGELAKAEQKVLGNDNLSRAGREKDLHTCIILNPGSNDVSAKQMATALEAILGAVHRDGGQEAFEGVLKVLKLDGEFLS